MAPGVTFERTADMALVREILTEPRCWRRMVNDDAPPITGFNPAARPGIDYVVAMEDGRAIALFVLIDLDSVSSVEVHFCFRPDFWGRAVEIGRAFVEWVWRDTSILCLRGPVPEYNRLALQLAKKCGFAECGRDRAAVRRRGKSYDRILLQVNHAQNSAPRIVPPRKPFPSRR